jgi:hypothetical protein
MKAVMSAVHPFKNLKGSSRHSEVKVTSWVGSWAYQALLGYIFLTLFLHLSVWFIEMVWAHAQFPLGAVLLRPSRLKSLWRVPNCA